MSCRFYTGIFKKHLVTRYGCLRSVKVQLASLVTVLLRSDGMTRGSQHHMQEEISRPHYLGLLERCYSLDVATFH